MYQAESTSHPKTTYERIPSQNKVILQQYLDIAEAYYSPSSIRMIRQSCSRFLLFLEQQGITHIKDIDSLVIEVYLQVYQHTSVATGKAYRQYLDGFLLFCIQNDLLPERTRCAFHNYSAILSPLVSSLNPKLYDEFQCLGLDESDWKGSMQKYMDAGEKLMQYKRTRHYRITDQRATRKDLHTFEVFLRINGLYCDDKTISLWLSHLDSVCVQPKFNRLRHTVLSVYEIMTTGQLQSLKFYLKHPKYPILQWQSNLLDGYRIYRERTGCAPSTWRTIHSACSRFFVFMNQHGIKEMKEIDGHHLKKFHLSDMHESFRSKNLYTSQLRLFLEYLVSRDMLAGHLPYALSSTYTPVHKLVSVLSPDEIEVLYEYRKNASSPMELRDSAFFLLGLQMGFRKVDIIGLRFSDISWKEQTISITQKKTGVFLKLPMPVDVGNSIYQYLKHGRPKQAESDYVFVRHMAPYCNLSTGSGVARRFGQILEGEAGTFRRGFHVTRRTFASCLLKTGSTVPVIVAALGHTGFSNVNKYLSTDEENLRKCAISMKNIEYKGAYNL